jgi:hypothetical protein
LNAAGFVLLLASTEYVQGQRGAPDCALSPGRLMNQRPLELFDLLRESLVLVR